MRIDDTRRREIDSKRGRSNISKSNLDTPSIFSNMLQEEEKIYTEHSLDIGELRRQIDEAGVALEEDPSLDEFNHFRDLIRTLTEKVSKEAYKLRTVGFAFRSKEYSIVTTIDEELSSLYKLIINEHKNHLAIANKVIKIKGLVVDVLS